MAVLHVSGSSRKILALLVANAALACGPWLVRLAEGESQVGALGSAFWRLALAWPILIVATRATRETMPVRWGMLGSWMALAGLLFAADLAAWHFGILQTRLANATLLGNVTAVLFPAYGFLAVRQWPSARQASALMLAIVGAMLLLSHSYQVSGRSLRGDLLCLFAGLCYTAYLIVIDRVRRHLGPITTLTGAVTAGAPALLLIAILAGDPVWPQAWMPLILLAGGSQLLGQGLILYAVSSVEPLLVGLMLLIQPVVAAAIGWGGYGERLTPGDLVGAAAVALGVLLVRDSGRRLRAGEIGVSA